MDYLSFVFNTPGIGGGLACFLILSLCIVYGLVIRWISKAD